MEEEEEEEEKECSQLELTVFNSISFAKGSDHIFVALPESANNAAVMSDCIGNAEMVGMCDIAIRYAESLELARKQLYKSFMCEVIRLFSLAAATNDHFGITYEEWAKCFNVVFTSVLRCKLQTCSSYSRGGAPVLSFRNKVKIDHQQDTAHLAKHYKATKEAAAVDVKDIMRVLNLVLHDCCGSEDIDRVNTQGLLCKVDYSSLYKPSSVELEFSEFIVSKMADNAKHILSFGQLLLATEPEAILMETHHKLYNDERVTVSNTLHVLYYIKF